MSTQDLDVRPNRCLLGVVLCGGKSSRMGRDKSLLPHPNGGRFIDHAIDQLHPLCDEVCVAGSSRQTAPSIDRKFLCDEVAFQGPITGIVNAMKYAKEKQFHGCLVTPVDMPWLTKHELSKLKDTWQPNQPILCGIDQSDRLQPLVAIYPIETLPNLTKLSHCEDRSLLRWLKTQPYRTTKLSLESAQNVNRPEEL